MRVGAYPGTFDPPTVAHLAVAEAAWLQGGLDRVDLIVTREPLGKGSGVAALERRVATLERLAAGRRWMEVRVSPAQLIVDACRGYDCLVLGADKWLQINDPAWYGSSVEARDRAVAELPQLLLAPRPPWQLEGPDVPATPPGTVILDVDPAHGTVSSTGVRAGHTEWLAGGA